MEYVEQDTTEHVFSKLYLSSSQIILRLHDLRVHLLFVFDNPNRPPFKRGHKVNSNMTQSFTLLTNKPIQKCRVL